MMNRFKKLALMAAVTALALPSMAAAVTYTYVGSWRVDGTPYTGVNPAFTGQAAAAFIFGGSASNYAISTVDANPANIDFQSWVSVWFAGSFPDCPGFPCGRKVAQDFAVSTGGFYQSPGDTSAFVSDWAQGEQFTNYAFTVEGGVPEPASWMMLITGFGLTGAALRRRRTAVVA
ncbi:PEPxxWA-CTERM sorting domain-containing protein [Sandarakinorhabdus oryzae]|uniref:PEPxxWA-CTERM sorting domain-containing protein n=1 Tax=Sandarakinorhabdus oryzae TaxID=2675220 RepID=UPI0012E2134E|nr:PEPxxWA-CTERM sorting domain-containing protein [Sandarakinorhabdus oryzae]